MSSYDDIRKKYKPDHIKYLLIAESPPPAPSVQSSRQFYYTDRIRRDDRLFVNTIRALYDEAVETPEQELEEFKEGWLNRLKADGWYMIETLEDSQPHEATKQQRQERIRAALPSLLARVRKLADDDTRVILIKSNVFDVAAEPLRDAGFMVLNKELVDYPGRYNQKAFRQKLRALVKK